MIDRYPTLLSRATNFCFEQAIIAEMFAAISMATCGEVQWASYWANHGNATSVPPRTCKTIADYECYADENWWPKPDNSTPVNGIDEPWSQGHCASVCTTADGR
jgi:hypothetical protein